MRKIDYEITVDVSSVDVETKKRVQDAFFKLGIVWADGRFHRHLGVDFYTNTFDDGSVSAFLMYSAMQHTEPTHTIDELLELAGMKETNLIPFDLERALAGDPVVTREGDKVTQLTKFEGLGNTGCLVGVLRGTLSRWYENGEWVEEFESEDDLFMAPKTHIVNGFEVPLPLKESPNDRQVVHVASPSHEDFFYSTLWRDFTLDYRLLKRGLVFETQGDAIANAKAQVGMNPYGDDNE